MFRPKWELLVRNAYDEQMRFEGTLKEPYDVWQRYIAVVQRVEQQLGKKHAKLEQEVSRCLRAINDAKQRS